jgi:hypothetical protein
MNKAVRRVIEVSVAGVVLALLSAHSGDAASAGTQAAAKPIAIKVYKTPQCGCCKAWVQHLSKNGFQVQSMDMPDLALVKQKYGVKPALEACHTAVVNGYVVEGHVPADVIKKLLKERPAIVGIAVPGMPAGSPGMEGAMKERYDVLAFDRAGRSRVYASR